ncbi:hypothetical protein J5N97_018263 [Dioscorea zingiberensis]|uniref:RING-type E3 ubiquitin transferase n=1 Tax=Dioscorea zingiberensis TaxID=325984 RepID=A0A9D5CPR7_9LILI|nr:hypothetical protein J5N97_018263 [Dioscorea zingiberensis]
MPVVSHAPIRYIPVVYNPSVYQHGSSSSTPAPKFLIYCFIAFFALVSVFILWCTGCFSSHRNQCRRTTTTTATTSTTTTNNNVRKFDVKSFGELPVFVYSEKEMEKLECVVCLAEFKDGEKGRILTQCNHRFHMSCIDKWLKSHSTCPLCRANPASISSELPV